nr:RIO1 family regulatory kinase/ATPase [Anaerolinea sp.]
MPRVDINQYLNDDFDPAVGRLNRQKIRKFRSTHAVLDEIAQHTPLQSLGADQAFNPTLGSSRHEREWIFTYLGQLYNAEFITDVLRRVKGGKEANVYVCAAHPSTGKQLLAAKLYRPRMLRNLRNDSRYRANRVILDEFGKVIHDHGVLHAVRKGTSYGKEITHNSWLKHEYAVLQLLYDAGLPVPEPVVSIENTILMQYIGDINQPAPNLTETTLSHKEALRVRNLLIEAIEQAYIEMGRGEAQELPRRRIYQPRSNKTDHYYWFNEMAGIVPGIRTMGLRVNSATVSVTRKRGNARFGFPGAFSALVFLFDTETNELLAVLQDF